VITLILPLLLLANSNKYKMKTNLRGILTLLLAFVVQLSFAQEKTITGTVVDADNLPIPGVNIKVKGTDQGTQTDFDGNFSLESRSDQTLVFTYLGYETKEVPVGSKTEINVTLEQGAEALDEVLVVGYGNTTKERFTGTATQVETENIQAKSQSNVTESLRGEVAGVNVVTRSGAPGETADIRIRGFGSVNGNRDPLYIVDGAPYQSDIASINPNDIADLTVLKDAAATSIYGSRGANGVVIITTKKGKSGTSVINVNFRTSVNDMILPTYDVIESPEEFIELSWQALKNKGRLTGQSNPGQWASDNLYTQAGEGINPAYNIWDVPGSELIDPQTGQFNSGVNRRWTPTKWRDAAFDTGIRNEVNLQFSGGSEKTQFSTSFGYLDDEGYTINSRYTRYTTRINVQHEARDWVSLGGNLAYTGARFTNSSSAEGDEGSSGNIFALTSTTPPIYDVFLRDAEGNLIEDPIFGGNQFDYGSETGRRVWTSTNGIGDATYDLNQTDVTTLVGNFNVDFTITDWLSFELRYSGQYDREEQANRGNAFYGSAAGVGGNLFLTNDNNINQNFLQLVRFNEQYGDHSVEVFAAHEATSNEFRRVSAGAQTAILPNTLDLAQYTTPFGRANSFTLKNSLDSYFSQFNYDYQGKYFLTSSIRRDGSSRFKNDKWGTFGSVGVSWIMTEENFMDDVEFVDFLKLKGSWGVIGDQGDQVRYGYQLFDINNTSDGSYSFTQSSTKANEDLTWETSKSTQIGFESSLFNSNVNLDVDYYIKNTENLFFTQNLPGSSGFQEIQFNDGVLRNSGLEFNLQTNIIAENDYSLSFNINGEVFDNEITEMPNDFFTGEPKIRDRRNAFVSISEGKSIFDFYMREWAGVNPATGAGLWNQYFNDVNNDGILNAGDETISDIVNYRADNPNANIQKTLTNNYGDATRKYVGSPIPDIRGGFRLNASYKNFDLSAQFAYSIGGEVYDSGYSTLMQNRNLIGGNNYHVDARNAWEKPGDITNVPRLSAGYGPDTSFARISDRFLVSADYLAFNNFNLGYTLPQKFLDKMKINTMRLFISGDNLMLFSARDGLNPTTMVGTSNSGVYMPTSTFSLGLNVKF